MDKIALKIIIAGRTYPLTIKKEEESAIRSAADRINSNIQKLQGSYAVKDMQDLLAMTALQIAVQQNNAEKEKPNTFDSNAFNEDLRQIIEKIDA
jgi:cell division protein ZapA